MNPIFSWIILENKILGIFILLAVIYANIYPQRITKSLKNYGFVDIYCNEDKMGIQSELPQKASLKVFKRLSIKEVKSIINNKLTNDGTWNKLAYEQKSFLKSYSDIYYKKFRTHGDSNHEVVAFFSNHFDIKDTENKINITYAMLENPQCGPQLKENLNRFISRTAYNPTYSGYRYYLIPKDMPLNIAVSFDYNYSYLTRIFNTVPYSNTEFLKNTVLENYTLSAHISYYIATFFAYYTIIASKYYISSIYELAFFLQSIDASAFAQQFSTYIEQLNFRLKPDSINDL